MNPKVNINKVSSYVYLFDRICLAFQAGFLHLNLKEFPLEIAYAAILHKETDKLRIISFVLRYNCNFI
jgi:hypothetical protein